MKKTISVISLITALAVIYLFTADFSTTTVLADTAKATTFTSIKVDNKTVSLKEGKPYKKGSVTFLPATIVKNMGGSTGIKSGKEVLTYKNLSVSVNTGNYYATSGKEKVYLGAAVESNKSGQLFIPSTLFTKVFHAAVKTLGNTVYLTTSKLSKLPLIKTSLKPTPKPTPESNNFVCSVKVNGKALVFSKNKPAVVEGLQSLPALDILKALKLKATYKTGSLTTTTIDGKSITFDNSTGLFDYKGTAYMPYQAFEKLLTTVDWFDENKVLLINAYSRKKVWTHVNQAGDSDLIEKGTIWQQVDILKRLIQSGTYERKHFKDYHKNWFDEYVLYAPKDKKALFFLMDTSVKTSPDAGQDFYYKNGVPLEKPIRVYNADFVLYMYQSGFGEYTRHKVRKILKMAFPNNYIEAYDKMMKVLRQELWESEDLNDGDPTLKGWYRDNRTLQMSLKRAYNPDGILTFIMEISHYGVLVDAKSTLNFSRPGSWEKPDTFKSWLNIVKKYGLDKE